MMWLIFGCMIVTVIPRVVPFLFVKNIQLPDVVLKWLSFIPICIFTALIAEHLFVQTTKGISVHWMYLAVLMPTVLVALWTKSLSITVLIGVMLMGAARWFF
ncbi:AzlD domain-containing protein [Bacillus sp. Bos-x628]|uniref:AzlD domain-containing protein n=1 Tax=Bacillus maqinnsis TaxID=3229854 RepID=UPI00338D95CD